MLSKSDEEILTDRLRNGGRLTIRMWGQLHRFGGP